MEETKQTILVVDDTPENIDVVVGVLSQKYKVKAAPNGEKALKIVAKNPPSLILLDIMMPGIDGYETCKRLKENPETSSIPVIFLTAKAEAEDVVKGLRLGAVDYVTKPFNPNELLVRVSNVSDLNRQRQQLETLVAQRTVELEETNRLAEVAKVDADIKSYVQQLRVAIPSKMRHVAHLLDYLDSCYRMTCQSFDIDLTRLSICLNESLTNAVVHGNLEVPSSLKEDDWSVFEEMVEKRESTPEYADRKVLVDYQVDESQLKFKIQDQGAGFDPSKLPDPNDPLAMLSSGRGIMLIRTFMNHVSWNDKGNKITMVKDLETNR